MNRSALPEVTRAQAAMVRWFLELTHYGLFATDANCRVIAWNRWMQVHTGQSAEEVVGHPLPGSVMRGGTLARLRTTPLH